MQITYLQQRARDPQYRGRLLNTEIITPAGRRCRLEDFEAVKRAIRLGAIAPEIAIELLDDQIEGSKRILANFTDAIRDCILELNFRQLVTDRVVVGSGDDQYEIGKVKGKLLIGIVEALNYGHDIGIRPQRLEVKAENTSVRVRVDSLYPLISAIRQLLKVNIMLPDRGSMQKVDQNTRVKYDWEGSGVYATDSSPEPGVYILSLDNRKTRVIQGEDLMPIPLGDRTPYAEIIVARRMMVAGKPV